MFLKFTHECAHKRSLVHEFKTNKSFSVDGMEVQKRSMLYPKKIYNR